MYKFEYFGNFVDAWAKTMCEIGANNEDIIIIDADLAKAAGNSMFSEKFPERHFNVGIAEQDMVGFATGLAECGKIPFVLSFACFATQRACDQLVSGVAYNNSNVKVIGIGAGLTCAKNGGTHMGIIDLGIVRSIPNFEVYDPADAVEFAEVIRYAAEHKGPVYIRSNRGMLPVVHEERGNFKSGKAEMFSTGSDITLVTTGICTAEGIIAVKALNDMGISVDHLHMPSIKPFDTEALVRSAKKTGKVITCENHSIYCGLGSVVCEVLSELAPVPVHRLGLQDCFGETADLSYLCKKYKIDADAIISKTTDMVK